jgi:large conductance mechanosensitive channel
MKKIIKEFKEFAVKGNALELATAVIIGGAFGKIVSSLVADVIMPLISLLIGGNTFADWQITLRPAVAEKTALVMNLGLFIQNIVDFLIIAATIFLMVKLLAKLKAQLIKAEAEPEVIKEVKPTKEQELLTEIRDLLKK